MATISTSQDFDSAARTAGEAFTINSNATLTINTDTRWHKNAPSGVNWGTGSVSSFTMSANSGGKVLIDARNVRWIPYTSGSGNVPTIGTTITGGTSGVTGELLGVYSGLGVSPTAAGSAVPASGFLKFKSTSGTFNSSEALTGIGATTSGTQVTGWIEVTMDDAAGWTIARPQMLQSRGDWFYLDNTTGARSQTIQTPNPGGANYAIPGIWVEDGFLTGAIADDGGVQTNETNASRNSTTNDLTLLPTTPAVNDAYYFGYYGATWSTLNLNLTTQGVGTWTITWEYWNGSSWASLSGVSDGSTGFTATTGWKVISWTVPGDWSRTSVSSINAYWVRARVSAYTSVTTAPKGGQAGAGSTGVYEFWPGVYGTTYFGTSHLGTDDRSRFVQSLGSGQVRIGNNGTTDVGALPPAGCRTRIPNILLKSCATASRASDSIPNATLATRPDFTTVSAGQVDLEYTVGHWYFSLSQAYSCSIKHSAWWDQASITEIATSVVLTDAHNGTYSHGDTPAMILTSNLAGGTVTSCKWGRSGTIGSADYGTSMTYCKDFTFVDCIFADRAFRTSAAGYAYYGAYCSNMTFTNTILVGHALYLLACLNCTITGTQYADNFHTTSSATTPPLGVIMLAAGCNNILVDGLSWYTWVANVHPDNAIFYSAGSTNVRFRNVGTRASPLNGGSSNAILYVIYDAGTNIGVEAKRIYMSNVASYFWYGVNSSKGALIQNCAGDYADVQGTSGTAGFVTLDGLVKNLAMSAAYTAFTSVYGTIFYNIYTSTSAGRLGVMLNEDTATYAAYVTKTFTGASGYTSGGSLALLNLNDEVIYEYPYWIYGVDSFQNAAVTLSGTNTANHTVTYQIDTGSGWNGTWKASTGANLSGESFTASGGFRFKFRIVCNTANASNALTGCYFLTNANTTAQDIQYPLDVVTVSVSCKDDKGLTVPYARVRVENSATSALISQGTADVNGLYSDPLVSYTTDTNINVICRLKGYQNFSGAATITSVGASIPVTMPVDEAVNLP